MVTGQEPAPEPPALVCARLLSCRDIRADQNDPDAGWSLDRVIVHVRPTGGRGFPF